MRELDYPLGVNALNASENHGKICRTDLAQ